MDWHILTMLPLLGLTGTWRGVRIGGQVVGDVGGFGASNNPLVQAFDKAKAAGDREGMERAARQLNEQRMERNRAKSNAQSAPTPASSMFNAKLNKGDVVGAIDQSILSADKALDKASQTRSRLSFNARRAKAAADEALRNFPLL